MSGYMMLMKGGFRSGGMLILPGWEFKDGRVQTRDGMVRIAMVAS